MPVCAVAICKNRSNNKCLANHGISYHVFPKDPNLKKQWIDATGRPDNWFPTKCSVICSAHFEPKMFQPLKKHRLLYKWAVPKLKLRYIYESNTTEPPPIIAGSSHIILAVNFNTNEYDPSLNCSVTPADQILVVPEPNDMIVNVYHYLQNEYEILKKSLATSSCELSYLADILKRTAEATGASKDAVTKILRNRKRSQDTELATATTAEKRSKADYYFDDDDVSVIEEDSASEKEVCESDRGAEDNNCSTDVRKTKLMNPLMKTLTVELEQTDQIDPVIETLKIEIDEQQEENTEAANELIRRDLLESRSSQSTTAVQYFSSFSVSPTNVEVKIEPPDEDLQSSVHVEPCVHVTKDATRAPPPPPPGADAPSGPPPS